MKRRLLLPVVACFVLTVMISHGVTAQALAVPSGLGKGNVTLSVRDVGVDDIRIDIACEGISYDRRTTAHGIFTVVSLNGYGHTTRDGQPQLPVIRRNIPVPHGASARVEVLTSVVKEYTLSELGIAEKFMPVQPSVPKIPGAFERAVFQYDETTYERSDYLLKRVAEIVPGGSVREQPFAVLEVYPVDYNPGAGTVKIFSEISLRIVFDGADPQMTQMKAARYSSKSFDDLQKKILLSNERGTGIRKEEGIAGGDLTPAAAKEAYLIVTAPAFESTLAPFVQEKATYYEVTVATTTQTGTTRDQIKAYIQNAFSTWTNPPVYVLLVGDVDAIPNWTGTGGQSAPTDLNYSTLDGSDFFPDVFLGRLSVKTTAQLSNVINKILSPATEKKAIFPASTDNYNVSEGTHNYVIANYFAPAGWTTEKLYTYTYDATTAQLKNSINSGKTIIAYSGHGSTSGWLDGPGLYTDDIPSLTNTIYPVVFTFACETGDFTVSESYAEAWIRNAAGGAGYIGSSVTSSWTEDDRLEKGVFRGYFTDNMTTVGKMLVYGKYELYKEYGNTSKVQMYYEMYNLFGDPSQEILPSGSPPPPGGVVVNLSASPVSAPVGTQILLSAATTGSVASVTFRINGTVATTDASAPYQYSWTPSEAGNYSLRATAYGTGGDSAASTVNVTITSIVPPPGGDSSGYVVVAKDDFNRPDQVLPGLASWKSALNQGNEGTIRIVNNAIEAYNTTANAFGTVVWDSLCTAGTEACVVVRQKSGDVTQSSLMIYARMNSKDFLSGSGYRMRFWEKTNRDLLEIQRVNDGYVNFETIASARREVAVGDTLRFRVRNDAAQTMEVYVNSALIISSEDATYKPSQWYFALRSCTFATPARFDDFMIRASVEQTTGVEDDVVARPADFVLDQNYPNPFNPSTTIRFSILKQAVVKLQVFNTLGQEMALLVNGVKDPGEYTVSWNAEGMTSGVYFYRLVAGDVTEMKKMVLMR